MIPPANEQELDDLLSQPNPADISMMRGLEGDLLVLGAGGKMGPTLARRAMRAAAAAGVRKRIMVVARFSEPGTRERLAASGVETIAADLLDEGQLAGLPECANVVFMAARKFGTAGNEPLTWALNTLLPARVAARYRGSKIVAFSTGNVYPLVIAKSGGATESTAVGPVGEYAQSALGRERMFQYFSSCMGTPVTLLRLNYAIDLRYGVLLDIGQRVWERRSIDLSMGYVNVIWQGDANSVCLRSFSLCQSPPYVLNLTGPQVLSVRSIALRFAEHLGVSPIFENVEADTALISNASLCWHHFGVPEIGVDLMVEWVVNWIRSGGRVLGKPTNYGVRDGKF